jgi:hypothetical protein
MVDILSSLEDLRHAGAEFLIADLQTGITFTDIALRSKDEAVIDRNRRSALKAYYAVSRLAAGSHLSEADGKAVGAILARLKEKLASLGEETG